MRGFVKVLCVSRLSDNVNESNFARLLSLFPNLEVIDLSKGTKITFQMMQMVVNKLQLVCVIDVPNIQQMVDKALQLDAETKSKWLQRTVWLGAHDFNRYLKQTVDDETRKQPDWQLCAKHHYNWFDTILLRCLPYSSS